MNTPAEKADLQRRLEYFKLRRRLQAHSLPWQVARWVWVGTKLMVAAALASPVVVRQVRFNLEERRAREADRLDRLRNPYKYRLQS